MSSSGIKPSFLLNMNTKSINKNMKNSKNVLRYTGCTKKNKKKNTDVGGYTMSELFSKYSEVKRVEKKQKFLTDKVNNIKDEERQALIDINSTASEFLYEKSDHVCMIHDLEHAKNIEAQCKMLMEDISSYTLTKKIVYDWRTKSFLTESHRPSDSIAFVLTHISSSEIDLKYSQRKFSLLGDPNKTLELMHSPYNVYNIGMINKVSGDIFAIAHRFLNNIFHETIKDAFEKNCFSRVDINVSSSHNANLRGYVHNSALDKHSEKFRSVLAIHFIFSLLEDDTNDDEIMTTISSNLLDGIQQAISSIYTIMWLSDKVEKRIRLKNIINSIIFAQSIIEKVILNDEIHSLSDIKERIKTDIKSGKIYTLSKKVNSKTEFGQFEISHAEINKDTETSKITKKHVIDPTSICTKCSGRPKNNLCLDCAYNLMENDKFKVSQKIKAHLSRKRKSRK